jgi:hypothetical protein
MRSSTDHVSTQKKAAFVLLISVCGGWVPSSSSSSSSQFRGGGIFVRGQTTCPTTRERKAWNDLTCTEQNDYLTAVRRLKQNGVYDAFVQTHIRQDGPAHGTAEFLPWHRWFIYQFEEALQSVADDPCITLPYWDWEKDAGRETQASVLDSRTFGSFVGRSNGGGCNWPVSTGGCLQWNFDLRFRFWSERRIVALIANYQQYADDFPNDPNRNNGFRAELEGGARKSDKLDAVINKLSFFGDGFFGLQHNTSRHTHPCNHCIPR